MAGIPLLLWLILFHHVLQCLNAPTLYVAYTGVDDSLPFKSMSDAILPYHIAENFREYPWESRIRAETDMGTTK